MVQELGQHGVEVIAGGERHRGGKHQDQHQRALELRREDTQRAARDRPLQAVAAVLLPSPRQYSALRPPTPEAM